MKPTDWGRNVWIGVLITFLVLYVLGEALATWLGTVLWPFPQEAWWVLVSLATALLFWAFQKPITELQELYDKSRLVQGMWGLVLAIAYFVVFFVAVRYLGGQDLIPKFLNRPLSGNEHLALTVLVVAVALFVFQPTLTGIFGKQKLFANTTFRLTVAFLAAVYFLNNVGGAYDYKTGESILFVDEKTGEYSFSGGKSPRTGNDLKPCAGAKDKLKEMCDAAAKSLGWKKKLGELVEEVPGFSSSGASSPATTSPPRTAAVAPPVATPPAPAIRPECVYQPAPNESGKGVSAFDFRRAQGCKEVIFVPVADGGDLGTVFFPHSPCGETQRPKIRIVGRASVSQDGETVNPLAVNPGSWFYFNGDPRNPGTSALVVSCS